MRHARWLTIVLIACVAIVAPFVVGIRRRTKFGPLPQFEAISPDPAHNTASNVALYVSDMPFEPKQIEIRSEIDGRTVVRGVFEADPRTPYTRYLLKPPPGKHRLKAQTLRGKANLEREISIPEESHIGISDSYGQPSLVSGEIPPTITYHTEKTPWIPPRGLRDSR